jgi:hypothetical protein
MKPVALGLAAALGLGAVLLAADARALGPVGIEAGAKGGTSFGLNNPPQIPGLPIVTSGPAVELGGRAGVSFFHFYAGVSGMYGFGRTATVPNTDIKSTGHSVLLGVEAGYTLKVFGPLSLRPQVGLGNDQISASATPIPISQSSGYFYLEPDLLVLVTLGAFYVGADVGVRMLPSGPGVCASGLGTCHSFDSEVTLHAQLGVSF